MSTNHDWLNLIEASGPFLAVPVLREVLPQGLEALTSGRPQRLRAAYDEWRDAVDANDADLPSIHAAWIDEVLQSALEVDDQVLRRAATLPERLKVLVPEHGVTIAPDLAIVNPTHGDAPLLLVQLYDPDTDLDATRNYDGLATTPGDRMVALLRAVGCPVGLVTNGERWVLVHAPVGAVASFASWYARLWGQEPETLRAYVSLLGVRRFFGPEAERLPALFERSLKHQDDVTDALGEQVRRAVEVLVQSLDRADQDRNRDLLHDVDPKELYEAGLTIMMRLVFLLAAEERGLLLLGDPRYDAFYALSSLRMQLRADTEEILERRRSAWSRLLALFRGVYGGIDHPLLRLPAMGGSLFDPDRYPFLEGRKKGTNWRSDPAEPLPIDDRTVLLLLEAIQTFEGRTLSYRALDVEQIGHVYEGLLERTVQRVDDVTLELDGSAKAKNARVALGEIESARLDGAARIVDLLKERSERSEPAIRNAVGREPDERMAARLLTVCRGDVALRDQILPYAELLRTDPWGYPLVHHAGAFVVVLSADRRESGTHYTPKSLTEKIVEETLTPIVYRGPAEGTARKDWKLRSAEELLELKICDPAMGSGAFLVQACRWLADRLLEAWSDMEATGGRIDDEGRIRAADDTAGFEPLSRDTEERAILARRLIAERCLYGVDKNPLAVELAKLSLWLTTLAKGRPFGFLDHNLRSGDSLLGIHDLGQLIELDMKPKGKAQLRLFGRTIRSAVDKALALRTQLRSITIRDIGDVEAMVALDAQSRTELALPAQIADAFVGIVLAEERAGDQSARIELLAALGDDAANGDTQTTAKLWGGSLADLAKDSPDRTTRRPFHWPLEFPEVFTLNSAGFNAFVGNPPFLGGKRISEKLGAIYNSWLSVVNSPANKNTDLVAHFFRRCHVLLRRDGVFGLLATNTISEGQTRVSGLDYLLKSGCTIYSAYPHEEWPGAAAVATSRVHLSKGVWNGKREISGHSANHISAYLSDQLEWTPQPLSISKNLAFQGSNLNGIGFAITPHQYHNIIESEPECTEVLFPFLNGDDLNSQPDQRPTRYVVNFWDWDEDEASKYEAAFELARQRVKPHRDSISDKKKRVKERWWVYESVAFDLYNSIGRGGAFKKQDHGRDNKPILKNVIAIAETTKFCVFQLINNDSIYSHTLKIFASDDSELYAILNSSIHEAWARKQCSTLETRLKYNPTSATITFPFPNKNSLLLARLGKDLHSARKLCMLSTGNGMTKTYNAFHDPSNTDNVLNEIRKIQQSIDRELAKIYEWKNLDLEHDFHEVAYLPENDRVRFTISEPARLEVLRRLSELNRQQYQEETKIISRNQLIKPGFDKASPTNGGVDLFSIHAVEPENFDD